MNVKPIHSQNENKKYDCTKTVDFVHERERMCKTVKKCKDCPIHKKSTTTYCLLNTISNEEIMNSILVVQEWSDTNPEKTETERERPTLSEKDITVLKALQIMGYHWIAKDKDDDDETFAYREKPTKYYDDGVWGNPSSYYVNYNFSFLSWEDKEPINIDWLLGGNNYE